MISRNDFNSQWWGAPVGIIREPAFFEQPIPEQHKILGEYSWVEFRSKQTENPLLFEKLHQSGFFYVDTLIHFRIALDRITDSAGLEGLEVYFANDSPFEVKPLDMAPFEHERFKYLPGAGPERIAQRYAIWSNKLIQQYPNYCLRVCLKNKLQGWFLAMPSQKGLNLALAMLHADAEISGLLLYQKAMLDYHSRRDERLGWASFSVTNTAVLNIYSRLGAHFLAVEQCWIWVNR